MRVKKGSLDSIDEYIAMFPKEIQTILTGLRSAIKYAAPGAVKKNKLSNAYLLAERKSGPFCRL
jgi:hypothetical protein